ncbi:MAG: hypothetical protein CVT90_01755 [Candidatus Altiarchaeales archaeon HGW-Altiarchaeales-3]|nr:MAG: hypothetical protein CVT90_01755 [Candidatus Altiarchaeales archaeon HGW-Altiarchaeales-3]
MIDIIFSIILLALIGIGIGIITGLTPGLHVNTIAIIGFTSFSVIGLEPLEFAVVMVAMAVTHTFLDFLPAIFLGAPEEETALCVLPTHKLFLEGKALEAVNLTAIGSLLGLVFGLLLLIPALYIVPFAYNGLRDSMAYILIIAAVILILRERIFIKIISALLVFLMAGYLGILIFDQKLLSAMQILFPVFVGLFGLSNIIASLNEGTVAVPQNLFIKPKLKKKFIRAGFLGALGGAIVGLLPAVSPSQVGILMYELFGANFKSFLVTISAINTSDAIYSIAAIYTIGNARSGVAVMIDKVIGIDFNILIILVGVMAFTAFFATYLHLKIGKLMAKYIEKINYRKLCICSIGFILVLVYVFTGIFGVLLALLSMTIGLLPILMGVSRTQVMGVLIVPTALYFLGI